MQFLESSHLWLLFLLIIPIILYLFRRRSRQVNVSTLVFFKTLAREHQESAWLRKLKKLISFLLTAFVIVASVISLARLIRSGGGEGDNFRTYVVLLDRSASMAALDETGESRLDEARDILRSRMQNIPEEAGVALVAYDNRPELILPRTLVRREFLSRLDQVKVRPVAGDEEAAMETALMLANLETPALIIHAADHGNRESELELPEGIKREKIDVAMDSPINVGITSFQVRKTPLEQDSYDVHARISLNADAPESREVHLELFVGGVPAQVRDFELEPGDRESFEFKVRGAGGQILRMNISTEGDSLSLDDAVMVPLPEARPLVAVWIRENSESTPQDAYTSLALSAIQESGTLELLAGTPTQWPLKDEVDAVIFDGWLPEEWPKDIPVIVINPPRSSGPVIARQLEQAIPYDSVRVGNDDHPLLFRVSSSRIAVSQTAIIEPSGSFEPLWLAGNEPILTAGEVEGQRIVVMAFSPQISERLPLTASFPLLLGNAVFWTVEGSEAAIRQIRDIPTGEFVDVTGTTVTWTQWEGDALKRRELPLNSGTLEMNRTGIWQTDSGMSGTSFLLSANESNFPAKASSDDALANAKTSRGGFGSLVRLLVLLILLVLLVESWLFHRHALY